MRLCYCCFSLDRPASEGELGEKEDDDVEELDGDVVDGRGVDEE
ncbi:MAG: hypothetical protein JW384_02470 [Nitrosomonadaceae bacterium]|nr:hypothetical protein [Nitrosomonadaceae bacterium]